MSHADAVAKVYALMAEENVSLMDLELYGYIQDREEDGLTVSVAEAFNRLVDDGFNYWEDSRDALYWWEAGRDMVNDALDERGLYKEEE